MIFPALSTLNDALRLLSSATNRRWERSQFFEVIVNYSLPMLAATPNTARPVISAHGSVIALPLADVGRRHLCAMLTPHINDLWIHGEAQSSLIALEPGDDGYLAWTEIKARRTILDRANHTPESWHAQWPDSNWHDGELMGGADVGYFECAIRITDDTCRIPRETLEEIVKLATESKSSASVIDINSPSRPERQIHRIKRNTLDVPIEKAISQAGNASTEAVFLALRELALNCEPPFTGGTDGSGLCYTTDKNTAAVLTKNALAKRLKKHAMVTGNTN